MAKWKSQNIELSGNESYDSLLVITQHGSGSHLDSSVSRPKIVLQNSRAKPFLLAMKTTCEGIKTIIEKTWFWSHLIESINPFLNKNVLFSVGRVTLLEINIGIYIIWMLYL